jgi:hypothetical protein
MHQGQRASTMIAAGAVSAMVRSEAVADFFMPSEWGEKAGKNISPPLPQRRE